jgi:hypothetical protein
MIVGSGIVGTWKGDCLGCSSRVHDLTVRSLIIRSHNDIYQVSVRILQEDRATKVALV